MVKRARRNCRKSTGRVLVASHFALSGGSGPAEFAREYFSIKLPSHMHDFFILA
jgi:hypothetical protein